MTQLYSMNSELSNHDDGTNKYTHINITHIHTLYVLSTGEKLKQTHVRVCVSVCVCGVTDGAAQVTITS
jgi:hypothetical protein